MVDLLAEQDASDIVVFGGGIIPEADRALLAELGVAQVFTPGASMAEIVDWVRANVRQSGRLSEPAPGRRTADAPGRRPLGFRAVCAVRTEIAPVIAARLPARPAVAAKLRRDRISGPVRVPGA